MVGGRNNLVTAALSMLHYTGIDRLASVVTGGQGVIFMLHHVSPRAPADFEPNRILRVTPDFLEGVITYVQQNGFECVSLDEASRRIGQPGGRPFACFTLDDGYRDNKEFAYPIFKRHGVPFTIYLPPAYADGTGDLWWLTLEATIAKVNRISFVMDGEEQSFVTETAQGKNQAFDRIYWYLRNLPDREIRAHVANLAREAGYDPSRVCSDLVMTWDELRDLAKDPLVTIGAHTVNHLALAKLSEDEAREEISESVKRIEQELGQPCRHFSFPYGDFRAAGPREYKLAADAGIVTAVTTRKGLIQASHAQSLTALPRFSLNGDFQDLRFVKVMLSGLPFALWNGVSRLNGRRAASLLGLITLLEP